MTNRIVLSCIITLGLFLLSVWSADGKIIRVNQLTSSSKCLIVNDLKSFSKNVKINVFNRKTNVYGNASINFGDENFGVIPCKSTPCKKGLAPVDTTEVQSGQSLTAKSGQQCKVEKYTSTKGRKVTISKCFTVGSKKPANINVEVKVCKGNDTTCNTTTICLGPKPDVVNACDPNPCSHGKICQSEFNQTDYNCTCPPPLSGEKCEELDCKPNCFRWKDTVYYKLIDEPAASWQDAYQRCSDKGYSMTMLKDNDTYQFVQFTLLDESFKGNRIGTFWIGANRTSEAADWKWVDGSAVEKHSIVNENNNGQQLCVRMKAYYGMNLREIECGDADQYPLCQQSYPSLIIPWVNPCDPNPCLHGSSCELTEDKADYKCNNCRFGPSGGKNCSELPCDNNPCFAVGDKVLFLHGTKMDSLEKKMSWYKASDMCTNADQSMAVINDDATRHHVQVQLFILYSQSKHALDEFWIGLNPTSANKPWTWTDGQPAGTIITDVIKDPSAEDRCAKIKFFYDSDDYQIDHDHCGEPKSATGTLSLCQKSYPLTTK